MPEIDKYEVRDSNRTLRFEGTLLAESTSFRRLPDGSNADRWVEFELYKTRHGKYVLSRVGVSSLFHDPDCEVVERNDLKLGEIGPTSVPCKLCDPVEGDPVCVERNRYFAQVSDQPEAVLEALYKYDQDGTRYLTQVARRLIIAAGRVDPAIHDAYTVEYVS